MTSPSATRILVVAFALTSHWMVNPSLAAADNLAPRGTAIFGAASDLVGTNDIAIEHLGPLSEVNDGVSMSNLSVDAFQIDADGQAGPNGNGVDTFAGGATTNALDYVGVLFPEPQYGVASVRVQNFLANDGGWWGTTAVVAGGAPLTAADLTAPQVQVTSDGGSNWITLAASSNYVAAYAGVVRGSGFPNATSGPFATFTFAAQNGIDGIRLIGNGAGPADGNGFIGVNEFEVLGTPQQLSFEVDVTTGRARLVNNVQSNISFDFYQVSSAGGALDLSAAGWNSFENPSLNPAGFPGGTGGGAGWEELGNPDSHLVAEGFLLGTSTLAPGESATLGRLFAGEIQDLSLRYRSAAGAFIDVPATFLKGGLAADFDFNDTVNATDLAAWRANVGTGAAADADGDADSDGADFLVWQRQLGASAAEVSAVAMVPEPTSLALLLYGSFSARRIARRFAGIFSKT
jgi:hypothetical protein